MTHGARGIALRERVTATLGEAVLHFKEFHLRVRQPLHQLLAVLLQVTNRLLLLLHDVLQLGDSAVLLGLHRLIYCQLLLHLLQLFLQISHFVVFVYQ